MKVVLSPFIFIIHTALQILNLAFFASSIILLGLVKLLLPAFIARRYFAPLMNIMLFGFGKTSVMFIRLFNNVDIVYSIEGQLSKEKWYLIVANHLSYLDIILLINFACHRIPAPKFFLKRELIWMPFVGLGAWALDMPFMRRYSQSYLEKHPEKRGDDIETTKRSCQKFKRTPTTVINFVEGTRFTSAKHSEKGSNYQHLLPPKAGGVAFTLATMGDLFTNILDISLLYPDNTRHPMMEMLCGNMTKIIIHVDILPVPEQTEGDYFSDDDFRGRFQKWLNALWAKKDAKIQQLLEL